MKIPTITGVIDRRILLNYRIDPDVLAGVLPAPFHPVTVRDSAIGGICLIRLKSVRPKTCVPFISIDSENAAHRFAVSFEQDGIAKEGVYIPRRDTSSLLSSLTGGSIFPGEHHHSAFSVRETDTEYEVRMQAADGTTIEVRGSADGQFPEDSVFEDLEEASAFFERGCLGYSRTSRPGRFDGLTLKVFHWQVSCLSVADVRSSYLKDTRIFPAGSVVFDHALLMLGLEHEWHSEEDLCVS
ncbi:MAG: DUF2071 domain-containing protein [Cyanobacteria bacterium HKST-UBA02]|nr:DUF2071 domain-containing protein [Cyanobacteria bacterium HKST-UBA02]